MLNKNFKKAFWSFLEIFEVIIVAIVAVFIIRAFIAQPFLVSGSSMEPSFHNGNYLIVDELTYNFRSPQRGEIIVFNSPDGSGTYYIKRVIGLPGESVIIDGDEVTIISEEGSKVLTEDYILEGGRSSVLYQEAQLSEKEYFVMGDNRGFSFDSRSWGALNKDNIIGVVRFRLWPLPEIMTVKTPGYGLMTPQSTN
ncbi:MAG: signal peptidase I [Candidatus Paceibacterota bacterium]